MLQRITMGSLLALALVSGNCMAAATPSDSNAAGGSFSSIVKSDPFGAVIPNAAPAEEVHDKGRPGRGGGKDHGGGHGGGWGGHHGGGPKVPEPETIALMLAGLGVVWFVTARRRRAR